MRFGVLGTGVVGRTIANKLAALGHEVRMGSRRADSPEAGEWASKAGPKASRGTFADAAAFGEIVFNCTKGDSSLAAVQAAGADNLAGKVLIDVCNPLEFSKGQPPGLTVGLTDSVGEQIQRALPDTRVVKSLNTVNCDLMVDPGSLPGNHTMFVAGNDSGAKATVTTLLKEQFGWTDVLDLGDIAASRNLEAYVLLWLRFMGAIGTPNFNIAVVRQAG